MGRRRTVDEETAAIATERLAGLLGGLAPRRAVVGEVAHEPGDDEQRESWQGESWQGESGQAEVRQEQDEQDDEQGDGGHALGSDPRTRSVAPRLDGSRPPVRARGPETPAERVRGFGRRHLGVLVLILVIGLTAAGWALIRARPVAVATPLTVATTETPAPSSTGAATPGTGPGAARERASPGTEAASAAPTILVHVLGAVRRPGVVALPERSRVQDAIDAAGGLTGGARPGELNLAQILSDGQQVVIGTARDPGGEVRNGSAAGDAGSAGGAGTSSAGSAGGSANAPVDLNSATLAQLDALPGVGPVTAERILAWRSEHGRFARVEELQEVDGIGPKTYAQLAPHVRV
ncbi:helix-hairpin-helix domain-containing protein [Microlunatus ginsengisoli]|uniref:Helix-hairpin-helix DNA-binding motif class 1 domain-containing protein n=1 Tax=Microlunatus ginsengisoli TaxID=363863 RepID=A0ABP6ZPK6_9ACTN